MMIMEIKSLGQIGIGQMGMPIGRNLLKAGFALTVYARNKTAVKPLLDLGAVSVDSPKAVMDNSDVVVLALPAPKDVKEVAFGMEGLAASENSKGKTVIDTSTIDPKSAREIAEKLESIGIDYLDSPVSGGPEGAANASLTFMVGGKRETFQKCDPVFKAVGKNIFYMGHSGSGSGAKLVNQLLVSSNTLAAAEAMQLALALGLDSHLIVDVIKTSAGDSFAFRRVAPKIGSRNFGEGWQTWLLEKDLKLLLQTEADQGLPGVTVKSALSIFSESVKSGQGSVDSSSVITVLDKMKTRVES